MDVFSETRIQPDKREYFFVFFEKSDKKELFDVEKANFKHFYIALLFTSFCA